MVFACLDGSGLRIPTIDTNKSPLVPRICTVLQFFLHIQNISNLARNTEVVKTAQKYVHNRQSAVSFSLHDTSKLRKVLKIPTICQALLLHIGKYSIIRQRQYALVLFRKRLAKYYHWDKLSVDFKNRLKGTC